MNAPTGEDELLTLREVADLLKVTKMTVWRLRRDGVLPDVQIAGSRMIRVRRSAVDALLLRRSQG